MPPRRRPGTGGNFHPTSATGSTSAWPPAPSSSSPTAPRTPSPPSPSASAGLAPRANPAPRASPSTPASPRERHWEGEPQRPQSTQRKGRRKVATDKHRCTQMRCKGLLSVCIGVYQWVITFRSVLSVCFVVKSFAELASFPAQRRPPAAGHYQSGSRRLIQTSMTRSRSTASDASGVGIVFAKSAGEVPSIVRTANPTNGPTP